MPRDSILPLGDLPADAFREHVHRVAEWVADYRETMAERRIAPLVRPGEVASRFPAEAPATGMPIEEILRQIDATIVPGLVHWGHPAFLGYFGSTSNGPALLAEIVAAALNVSAMAWQTSPAATELETVVTGWIRQMVSLPGTFTGVVYDTASVGILHALAAARERGGLDVRARGIAGRRDVPIHRVYASTQAHSSIEKAMVVLGLGETNVVRVPCDAAFRLEVPALRTAMRTDLEAGHRPMAVIATVGTTSTASVDPVPEIASLCREHGAWLHVDAAYGGAAALLPEMRGVMDGAELADSVIVNPHKWMFVPLDFSVLFVRDPEILRAVFARTPEYLRGDAGGGDIDYMDYGLQLGRRFRALKAWAAFSAFGRDGLAGRIREHCRLARLWARWVDADDRFALAAPVMMGVVCFRCAPPGLDENACDRLNEGIVAAVNASGQGYLTHTALDGRVVLRVGIGNILTTEAHLEQVWAGILAAAASLLG
jgi:aromatic-L-amino-acid/L-tryptophan decarboxylase